MNEPDPWVLAIDASMPPSSVALTRGSVLIAACTGPFGRGADAWVIAAVGDVLGRAGIDAAHLDAVVACTGPGTFTGIRVGLAAALGLGTGAEIAVGGLGTLEVLAHAVRSLVASEGPILACNDARRGQVYALLAPAVDGAPVWGPEVLAPDELVTRLQALACPPAAGTGLAVDARLGDLVDPVPVQGGVAPAAAALAVQRWQFGALESLGPPTPTYLRPPDARPGANPLARARRRG